MSEGHQREMPVAFEIDRKLSDTSQAFDFLLYVTPTNVAEAWQKFELAKFARQPEFTYLPLRFDPDRLKSELYRLPVEDVEVPILAQIMRAKQEELDLQISMLRHRDSRRFFYGSLQLYGEPDDELIRLAQLILTELPEPPSDGCEASDKSEGEGAKVSGRQMADRARREIEKYRQLSDVFEPAKVEETGEGTSLMVCGNLLRVPTENQFDKARVEPLLHHEVGTHMVTYFNGCQQPLSLLAAGLAEYEPIQEGLAVLAEHLVGGLTRARMRLLAARVLVAARLVERDSFEQSFAYLVDELGFAERSAFGIVMRIYRGGGLTKDMIYLRGLVQVCKYLESGGDLDLLLVGKVALENIAALQELRAEGLVIEPAVMPRYLSLPGVAERLKAVRQGVTLLEFAREAVN